MSNAGIGPGCDREHELAECEGKILEQLDMLRRLIGDRESAARINSEESFLNRLLVRYYTIRREMNRGRRIDLGVFMRRAE